MSSDSIKEVIERYKLIAEDYLRENKKVFIKDINDQFYFAYILFVGESAIIIQCFAPANKNGEKYTLNWFLINKFEEYKEEK